MTIPGKWVARKELPKIRALVLVASSSRYSDQATGWTIRGSNPGRGKRSFLRNVQSASAVHSASYSLSTETPSEETGTAVFGAIHSSSASAGIKNECTCTPYAIIICRKLSVLLFSFYLWSLLFYTATDSVIFLKEIFQFSSQPSQVMQPAATLVNYILYQLHKYFSCWAVRYTSY